MNQLFHLNTVVVGFHGCHKDIKVRLLNGDLEFKPSQKEYDWLGDGIYFWENDPLRAKEWANARHGLNGVVIGAKIKLGVCFDMSNTYTRKIVKEMYDAFVFDAKNTNVAIPINVNPPNYGGNENDRILRYLDRAVLQYTFEVLRMVKFDTVRAPFQEGFELYKGSGFREYDHIHLCVRNPKSIKKLFDPDLS